jgi:uncharacterized peroxidase-related enzyme
MILMNVPVKEQVSPATQAILDQLQKQLGKVPNLYAVMGISEHALAGFLALENHLSKGAFTANEREAIALVVSQVNGCDYCLAAHTAAAMKRGFTKEETLAIRRGQANDQRLQAVLSLAKRITEQKGHVEEEWLDKFFAAGFNEAALMELVGLVTVRIFTNYAFALSAVPVDFPAAEPLKEVAVFTEH